MGEVLKAERTDFDLNRGVWTSPRITRNKSDESTFLLAGPHKTSFPPSSRGPSPTRHTFSPEIFQESRFKT